MLSIKRILCPTDFSEPARHALDVGADLAIGAALESGAKENNSGVGVSGMQGERRRQAGMHTDAGDRRIDAQRRLLTRFHTTRSHSNCRRPDAARN